MALNTIVDENSEARQILRANMPFGRVGVREFGTYFIGYARTPDVLEQMLTNMFVGSPPGTYDRILDFSTAITGTLFFVPSSDFLTTRRLRRTLQSPQQTRARTGHSGSAASKERGRSES